MNYKMRITIEIPCTGLEEDILRKGEWEDDSLFGRSLRNALMHFTKESSEQEPCDDVVNPEPKTGHWIYYRNEKGDYVNQCSECGQDCGVVYPYNFCPSCGIKMEGMESKDNTDDQYIRELCYECCNKNKSVLDMPCCKCSVENDYAYFNAREWEYESIDSDDEE